MALPLVMIVGTIILFASISLLTLINNSTVLRKASEEKLSAKYAAQAGVEHALFLYDKKMKTEGSVAAFLESSDIKDSQGNVLGEYSLEYIPPSEVSRAGEFYITGSVQGNAKVVIKFYIDISTGTITNYKQE